MQLRSGRSKNDKMVNNAEVQCNASDMQHDMRYAPQFSGEGDVEAYLMKLDVFKKRNYVSDENILDHALYALSGAALNFYKLNKENIRNFEEFKSIFKEEYGESIDPQAAHTNLTNLKQAQDEPVKAFVLRIKAAGQSLEKADDALTKQAVESLMRHAFVAGLRAPLQEKVFDKRCASLKDAIEHALALEKNPFVNKNASPLTAKTFSMQMQNIENKIQETVEESITALKQQTTTASVNRVESNAAVICQLCGKKGHSAIICYSGNSNAQGNFRYPPPRKNFQNSFQRNSVPNYFQGQNFNNNNFRGRNFNQNFRPRFSNFCDYNDRRQYRGNNAFRPYNRDRGQYYSGQQQMQNNYAQQYAENNWARSINLPDMHQQAFIPQMQPMIMYPSAPIVAQQQVAPTLGPPAQHAMQHPVQYAAQPPVQYAAQPSAQHEVQQAANDRQNQE